MAEAKFHKVNNPRSCCFIKYGPGVKHTFIKHTKIDDKNTNETRFFFLTIWINR